MDLDFPGSKQFKEKLKIHQKNVLKIFQNAHLFFKDKGFLYFIDAGTLLGSIRHKGWIPWDDDVDILMLEDQFDKLRKTIEEDPKIGSDYGIELRNTVHDKQHIGITSIGNKNDYIDIYCCQRYRYVFVNFLRKVYIFTEVYAQNHSFSWWKFRIRYLYKVMNKFRIRSNIIQKMIVLLTYPAYPLFIMFHIFMMILVREGVKNIVKLCVSRSGKYIHAHFNSRGCWWGTQFPISYEDVFPLVTLEFEGNRYPAPKNYKKILANLYTDYLHLPEYESRVPLHNK